MKQNLITKWLFPTLWIILIGGIAFLWNLGTTGLVDETEPLFAEASRQMTLTGDWITPYFNQETRFDKPPLVYWLMAIGYLIFGVNSWSVRLPSALSAIALMGLTFYTVSTAQKNQSQLPAYLASGLIGLNIQMIVWGRTGVSDMLLTACIGGSILSFFLGYTQKQFKWYISCYILTGLAILAKGPIGIVLTGLTIIPFLIYIGSPREILQEMRIKLGLIIILLISLPWYILVIYFNGQNYIDSFFGYHNIQRFTEVVNGHTAPWYFYFLVVLIGFAPWSSFIPLAIARLTIWKTKLWRSTERSQQLGILALFWFASVFIFFTIAVTKLPSYTLPLIPPSAILVALLFSNQITRSSPKKVTGFLISTIANAILSGAIALTFWLSPYIIGYDPAVPDLAKIVETSGLPIGGTIIWAMITILISIWLYFRLEKWTWLIQLIGFIGFILIIIIPTLNLVDQVRQYPLRELSAIILKHQQPQEKLIMIGFKKPSIVFYTQQPVTYFANPKRANRYIQQQPNQSFLVLIETKRIPIMNPTNYHQIAFTPQYQLIRIHPQN